MTVGVSESDDKGEEKGEGVGSWPSVCVVLMLVLLRQGDAF
jgi:hypothetical protein